ncbi:MAG: sugar phosphate isomerase/epimerase family protein [Planctomycetota bacterium]
MKLSLMTWDIAKESTLDEILAASKSAGIEGFEFRGGASQKHGVELTRTPAERAEIRKKVADAGFQVAGIATGCEFHFADPAKRREQLDLAKRYADLAADIGAMQIRVFSNDLPEGHSRDAIVGWTADCLRELAEHGSKRGVRANLELHGKFMEPELCVGAVTKCNHPNAGIVYNSVNRDIENGSIRKVLEQVWPLVRHVHVHEFGSDAKFPYMELVEWMLRKNYDGWCSIEVARLNLKSFLSIYRCGFDAYVQIAKSRISGKP